MQAATSSGQRNVPAHVPAELVFEFDLYNPPGAERDFQMSLKRLQDEHYPVIFWSPCNGGHWVATRGEDIHHIFSDYANFSSRRLAIPATSQPPFPLFPILSDPPDHARYRALINPSFSPKAVATLEVRARAAAIRLIENLQPRGGCEFVADFAQYLPIEVFMTIVDVPASDRDQLLAWANEIMRPASADSVGITLQAIFAYANEKIAARRKNPGEDLISRLTRATIDGRPLTENELTGMVALVLTGGLDAVVAALSFAALFLAKNPPHRKQLVDDPSLIPKAVDELLRRFPIANTARLVDHDTVYKNVAMKAGDMILLPSTLHGLDESAFPNPLQVDFSRPPPMHSTFGSGPHRCPGSNLARTEIRVFLQEWLTRIPDFRIPPGAEISMRSGLIGTISALPLEWDSA
jgi:cytochrome P450